jgi:hypothetical protein
MGRLWTGALAMALALAYCLSTTQLAYPFHSWLESRASSHPGGHGDHADRGDHDNIVAEQEIYPCAIHKCQCRNALQCKTNCCCFPKASASHGHGSDEAHGGALGSDRPTAALTACGGMDDVDGLLPMPVAWSPPPGVLLPEAPVDVWSAADFPAPPSPSLQAPFKVPIRA